MDAGAKKKSLRGVGGKLLRSFPLPRAPEVRGATFFVSCANYSDST